MCCAYAMVCKCRVCTVFGKVIFKCSKWNFSLKLAYFSNFSVCQVFQNSFKWCCYTNVVALSFTMHCLLVKTSFRTTAACIFYFYLYQYTKHRRFSIFLYICAYAWYIPTYICVC